MASDLSIMFRGRALSFCGGRASLLRLTASSRSPPNSCCFASYLLNVFSPNAQFYLIPLKRTGQCSLRGCVWQFSCRTTDTGALEVTSEMFAMAPQRGRPCQVPTDYRSFDHTAVACHRQLRSTGTTASPKRCWSKACLEFGVRFHWKRQESRGTVMEGERAFLLHNPLRARLDPLLWAVMRTGSANGATHQSQDMRGRGQRSKAVHLAAWLWEVTMKSMWYAHHINVEIWGERWSMSK